MPGFRLAGFGLALLRLACLRLAGFRLARLRLPGLRLSLLRLTRLGLPGFRLSLFRLSRFRLACFRLTLLRLARLRLGGLWLSLFRLSRLRLARLGLAGFGLVEGVGLDGVGEEVLGLFELAGLVGGGADGLVDVVLDGLFEALVGLFEVLLGLCGVLVGAGEAVLLGGLLGLLHLLGGLLEGLGGGLLGAVGLLGEFLGELLGVALESLHLLGELLAALLGDGLGQVAELGDLLAGKLLAKPLLALDELGDLLGLLGSACEALALLLGLALVGGGEGLLLLWGGLLELVLGLGEVAECLSGGLLGLLGLGLPECLLGARHLLCGGGESPQVLGLLVHAGAALGVADGLCEVVGLPGEAGLLIGEALEFLLLLGGRLVLDVAGDIVCLADQLLLLLDEVVELVLESRLEGGAGPLGLGRLGLGVEADEVDVGDRALRPGHRIVVHRVGIVAHDVARPGADGREVEARLEGPRAGQLLGLLEHLGMLGAADAVDEAQLGEAEVVGRLDGQRHHVARLRDDLPRRLADAHDGIGVVERADGIGDGVPVLPAAGVGEADAVVVGPLDDEAAGEGRLVADELDVVALVEVEAARTQRDVGPSGQLDAGAPQCGDAAEGVGEHLGGPARVVGEDEPQVERVEPGLGVDLDAVGAAAAVARGDAVDERLAQVGEGGGEVMGAELAHRLRAPLAVRQGQMQRGPLGLDADGADAEGQVAALRDLAVAQCALVDAGERGRRDVCPRDGEPLEARQRQVRTQRGVEHD